MRIAITSTEPNLDAHVETRFGRCAYFLIVDTDTMEFEAIDNPNIAIGGGAGIQSAQLMSDKGVQAVLTGNCGPNAFQVFGAAGIQVIVGVSGRVRDAIAQYKQGAFASASNPNVESHFGMGAGGFGSGFGMRGGGKGGGMGSGRGIGRGRGMGRGVMTGSGMSFTAKPEVGAATISPLKELGALKAEAKSMEEQLRAVNERIAELKEDTPTSTLVAVVEMEKCIACGLCEDVCPVGAINVNDVAEVNREKCTGCGCCVTECPQEAISLHEPS